MKITCIHGYFIFREDNLGEVARFNSASNMDLVRKDDYYTFSFLRDAPKYAIQGKPYLNSTIVKTYAGKPWHIFRENGLVYDFAAKAVVPYVTVLNKIEPTVISNGFSARGLIKPGSIRPSGQRVIGYTCHADLNRYFFSYSELVHA